MSVFTTCLCVPVCAQACASVCVCWSVALLTGSSGSVVCHCVGPEVHKGLGPCLTSIIMMPVIFMTPMMSQS
jgi:hypothetical protein